MSEEQKAPAVSMVVNSGELSPYTADKWFRSMMGRWYENPDETLSDHSTSGIALYDKMLRLDTHLGLCFRKRAGLVIAQGWEIHPAGETPREQEIADFIADVFSNVADFDTSRRAMFRGISHGYRPAEIIYKLRPDGRVGIERFRTRNSERFRFNEQNELVYVSLGQNQNQVMPAWKFVVNTWGSDETPYGCGMLRDLYPLWYFKATALKSYMKFLEKLGTPWIFGGVPEGTSSEDRNVFYEALVKMLGGHVGVGPKESEIQFLTADAQNATALFKGIVDEYVDREFAKAILGQTLSTESESGTFALARFQSKGQQAIVEEDALWQMGQLQPVVKTLVDVNFGPQTAYPQFRIPYEERADLTALGNGLRGMVQVGVPVTVGWALSEAGLPLPAGADESQLLEIKQSNPFESMFGPGAQNQADGLAAASESAVHLTEKKKPLRLTLAMRRAADLQRLADNARVEGFDVYAGWIDKQIARMKKAKSLTEINAVWEPQTDMNLVKHHENVLRSAELNGRLMFFGDAVKRGFLRWSEERGEMDTVPAQIIALDEFSGKAPLGPLDRNAGWEFFKGKIPMTASEYALRNKAWRQKAFSIAKLEDEWVVTKVKEAVEDALKNGTLLRDFIDQARGIYEAAGLTPASSYHLRTVYLTNVHGAANGARWEELQRDTARMKDFFPFLQYVTAGDDAVREEHAALDGLVLRRDDPAWATIYPPNGFNCRCMVEEISVYEAEDENIEPDGGLPAGWTGPDPGFESAPQAA